MIRRLALGALLVVSGAVGATAQDSIRLRDPGPQGGPAVLVQVLAGAYTVIPPAARRALLARGTSHANTVIVLGRDAVVEDTVRGDVIVIGGDLYMHPGADIAGRAIAIGGGVYESTAARIGGGVQAYGEFTYQITQIAGGWSLTYQAIETDEQPRSLPEVFGIRVPTYDRTDGVSLAVAPSLALPHTGSHVEPRLTYRSQLGRLDPSIVIGDSLDRRTSLQLSVGRSTFSNDTWIWTNLLNSFEVLWRGNDSRNYFRATRGDLTLGHRWESATRTIAPYVGTRLEQAESVRPGLDPTSGPWSFTDRRDPDDMFRPNPPIDHGTIGSMLTGVQVTWTTSDITARLRVDGELAAFSEDCGGCDLEAGHNFAQSTIDGSIAFPTFGTQRFRAYGHAVVSSGGGTTPRQRWAYVGGDGSIPTLDMLSQGGDQLFYLDARYELPIGRLVLPLVGSPVITLREVLGGAALGRFPALAQATGAQLSAGYVYIEWLVDPVRHHGRFSYGLTLPR